MMHGQSFDQLALQLAAQNALVVAPDLRGFGRSYYATNGDKDKTDYLRSLADLSHLLRLFKDEHEDLPFFCAGESLGAHLARALVTMHPELVDGLILSSPCVRPRMVSLPLIPHACSQLMLAGFSPEREVDLLPFAKNFLKGEPDSLHVYLNDPLTRKSLDVLELIDSLRIVGSMSGQQLPAELPVLVLRGINDCVCKSNSFKQFIDSLQTTNLVVHGCHGCGHLILQSPLVVREVMQLISSWLHAAPMRVQVGDSG